MANSKERLLVIWFNLHQLYKIVDSIPIAIWTDTSKYLSLCLILNMRLKASIVSSFMSNWRLHLTITMLNYSFSSLYKSGVANLL